MVRALFHRRGLQLVVIVSTLLLVGAFIACRVIGSIFHARLAAMVRNDLHAQLFTGSVIYWPPFTFLARDVRIVRTGAAGEPVELLRAGKLYITLDGIPHRGEPLPVRHIILDQPEVPLGGGGRAVGVQQIRLELRPKGGSSYDCQLAVADGSAASARASGVFDAATATCRVENFSLTAHLADVAARVPWPESVGRKIASAAPGGTLTVSGNGEVPLRQMQQASYQLTVDLADGTARLERWRHSLDAANGRLLLRSGPDPKDSAGWREIEATLDHFNMLAGTARIRFGGGTGSIAPSEPSWQVAGLVGSVELGQELPIALERTGWFFEQAQFKGPVEFTGAGGGPFRLPPGKSPLEVFSHQVLAYPHGMSVWPGNFSSPIRNITGGPITCRGGVVTLQNLSGECETDKLLLRRARLTLWDPVRKLKMDDLRKQIRFEELAGTVLFHQPGPHYAGVIGKTISQLRPSGAFVVGGGSWYAINRENGRRLKPDFFFNLIGDGGSFTVTDWNVPLTQIHGEATVTPLTVNITHFDAKALGGTAWAAGKIIPGKPFLYDGNIELRDIDLRQIANLLALEEPARSRLSGLGYATAHVSGAGKGGLRTPAKAVAADGEVQVLHGDFWSVPAIDAVVQGVKRPEELGTGDAAAVFHAADQTITLESAAVNSPLMGLQGTGTIGFDGSLYLTIVAAPLGDWRDKMRQANIPVVGDILGAIQQLFNTVQGVLLYQFRVTGTITHPFKTVIPAPVISDPLALLFGQMLQQDKNGALLTSVRATTQPAAPRIKAKRE